MRTATPKQKEDSWIKAKKKCEACGTKIDRPSDGHAAHKFAYSSGGSTKSHNLAFLCPKCNKNQGTMRYETFLKKYAKLEPRKYKKVYIKYLKEKKKSEVDEIKKKVQKTKIELHNTKSETKKQTLNNRLDKFKRELLKIDEKYKLVLGSKGKTPTEKSTTKINPTTTKKKAR